MSYETKAQAFLTGLGTDYKNFKTWMFGSLTGTLADLTTTNKTSLVAAINEVKASASGAPPNATETTVGVGEAATQAEVNAGTLDANYFVTPLKFQTRLAAYAQPLAANLTTLAGVASGAFGRTLLGAADANSAKTSLGLAAVATSGSASDITTGTLPSSVLPPLAINETTVVASQAAMLALTAQRGDIAKRTDLNGQAFVLRTDSPGTLADWIALNTTSDVMSVNSQTGAVVLTKSDVGLGNADNTSDANKPVSTLQQAALDLKLTKTANLSDLANVATARTNLDVYAKADFGNPDFDLLAAYTAAKS